MWIKNAEESIAIDSQKIEAIKGVEVNNGEWWDVTAFFSQVVRLCRCDIEEDATAYLDELVGKLNGCS